MTCNSAIQHLPSLYIFSYKCNEKLWPGNDNITKTNLGGICLRTKITPFTLRYSECLKSLTYSEIFYRLQIVNRKSSLHQIIQTCHGKQYFFLLPHKQEPGCVRDGNWWNHRQPHHQWIYLHCCFPALHQDKGNVSRDWQSPVSKGTQRHLVDTKWKTSRGNFEFFIVSKEKIYLKVHPWINSPPMKNNSPENGMCCMREEYIKREEKYTHTKNLQQRNGKNNYYYYFH